MSKLPGYLQLIDRENMQDKALNIGVLDWARLEKWKYKTKGPQADGAKHGSLASISMSSKSNVRSFNVVQNGRNPHKSKQLFPQCPRGNLTINGGVAGVSGDAKPSAQNVMRFQHYETTTDNQVERHKPSQWTYKSFVKNNKTTFEKEKLNDPNQKVTSNAGSFSSNLRPSDIPTRSKDCLQACDEGTKRVQEVRESDINRKTSGHNITLRQTVTPSMLGSCDISQGEKKKRMKELRKMAVDLSNQHQPHERKNIVLLLPRVLSGKRSQEESRQLDKNLTKTDQNRLSYSYCSKDDHSSEFHSGVPHLCSLPTRGETHVEPHSTKVTVNKNQEAGMLSDASVMRETQNHASSNKEPVLPSTKEFSERNRMEDTDGNLVETSKIFDHETAERSSKRGRHPSPNRRFNFSFSRMTRSFSLKESSSAPEMSSKFASVKSGPISEDSISLDAAKREKTSSHNRARSSPLRRMLDPLLKPIGLLPVPPTETDQPLKGSLDSFQLNAMTSELLQTEEQKASSIQGFLHFTRTNERTFFRLVVNKKNSIFAAPMKNSASTGKNGLSCNYTFYTIDEIPKKRGNWIGHGIKDKKCGFVYNVIAQMMVNSSLTTSISNCTEKNSFSQQVVKEFVLCGADPRQADQASPGFTPTREFAAAVFKVCDEVITGKGFSACSTGNDSSHNLRMNATVILPGGVHGLPNKGLPSPLIQRWISGGSCDCGGWDTGCKLQIIHNDNRCYQIPKSSKIFQMSDRFELYDQGSAQQDKPVFSLDPSDNGPHLVEFDPSISSLQALFICVTLMNCLKPSELVGEYKLPEDKDLLEPKSFNEGTKKISTVYPRKVPLKYTPCPPLSPVGRV
ncbi:hypothetical protein K2173_000161 [Erythroxylum novogranatense]|uniref:DUF3527 domain protein n=1 Tax=Erythroxylum novogranatense TaxID=1862640 RepID=A0AAV8SNN4_9ROSI|nr:hypothetical protein K2173_000161 [Erythroxylum novogranatense]